MNLVKLYNNCDYYACVWFSTVVDANDLHDNYYNEMEVYSYMLYRHLLVSVQL